MHNNTTRNRVFYIHGGPGFNSVAEEEILTPHFAATSIEGIFWNEKSPTGFTDLCEQLKYDFLKLKWDEVHMIAHSFGLFPLLQLLTTEHAKVKKLTLVAPPPDLRTVCLNILKLALRDFEIGTSPKPDLANPLRACISSNRFLYDEFMQQGFEYAIQDESLFNHYWVNKEMMARFFGAWAERKKSVNLGSFNLILSELKMKFKNGLFFNQSFNPDCFAVDIIFGAHDPIVQKDEQSRLLQDIFPQITEIIFQNSAHFPHLEESKKFLSHILIGIKD